MIDNCSNKMPATLIICLMVFSIFPTGKLYAQKFQVREISDKVSIISNPDLGSQVVVQSEKGLVVFDNFWSEITARIFKEDISKTLGRDDFSYVVNMADRLDMIGGNAAYQEAVIVGHENILNKYSSEKLVKEEIAELIAMWREKEGYSRNRLNNLEAGSEEALEEKNWMNKCITMAEELENSFSLVLPKISYNDKMTLDLGNIKIDFLWLGSAGNYQGLTLAVIPEDKLAIISKAFVYPEYHLAPYPFPYYGELDIPRWIAVLEQILEGENPVDNIILSDSDEIYPKELMHSHLTYIRKLWNSVKALEAEGKTLQEIQDQLSLERDFAFVKEMQVYKNMGDNWIHPQHEMHVKLFFLQDKILASRIIKNGGPESLQASLNKIKDLGSDIYYDEFSLDHLGFEWRSKGKISEAIDIYELNAKAFPDSFNAYNNLGIAYMKKGDDENAIYNLKKSLELNPDNNYAEELLSNLETK
jgi:tetratricopeptide (TPR) repeat protein